MRDSRFEHCYICNVNGEDEVIPIHSLGNDLFVCWKCMIEMLESFKAKKREELKVNGRSNGDGRA